MPHRIHTIFIFSMEPWGDMWYSKHHYAAYLAKSHTVYFVSLPDRWRWTDLFSFGVKVRRVPEGVNVVEYRNNLPLRALPKWLANSIGRLNAYKLRGLVPNKDVLFWCFHPIIALYDRSLRKPGTRFIYHVVDPYQNLADDSSVAVNADLIIAINKWYLDYYSALNDRCILIPHGVRRSDRGSDESAVRYLRDKWGDYALLATGLGQPVNYRLLIRIAERYPDLRLLIAGEFFKLKHKARALRNRLFALPNVNYVGVVHPDDLKNMVKAAKMGLLTYDIEATRSVPVSAGRTPLKVLTYLAQLCPVVSSNNSYVPELDGKGFFKARTEEHFVELVGDVLAGEKGVDHEVVNRYLDSVEYGALLDRIFNRLESVEPKEREVFEHSSNVRVQKAVAASATGNKYRIPIGSPVLIVSNEAWDGPRYSKHRYGIALSEHREVFFIDPPPQWKLSHLFRWRIGMRSTPEGIVVLAYHNAIPLFGGTLRGINDRIILHRISKFLKKIGRSRPLFWTFDPSRLVSPSLLDASTSVYHCADDHGLRTRSERLLARNCDHIFCIAYELMPRFKELNPSIHHFPHGVSDEDLAVTPVPDSDLPAPPGYGLYIGNISDRHDFELWEEQVRLNPDVNWVAVGPINVTDQIGKRLINGDHGGNLIFHGPVPYPRLRALIAGAGFGFLYMKKNHAANRISSQKVVQFLAQGKPVFSSWLSEYADRPDLVHMLDDHGSAKAQFTKWKMDGEPSSFRENRIQYAERQRFSNLLAELPFQL